MKKIISGITLLLIVAFSQLPATAQINRIGAIGITVKDMNTSVKFYSEVLGFKKIIDRLTQINCVISVDEEK